MLRTQLVVVVVVLGSSSSFAFSHFSPRLLAAAFVPVTYLREALTVFGARKPEVRLLLMSDYLRVRSRSTSEYFAF